MKTNRVKATDRERIRCMRCAARADICEQAEFDTGGHAGISFWYYCDPCFAEITEAREGREAYRAASARANAQLRVFNALQVVKDAILEADADGLPAWENFRALRSELVRAGILAA